MMKFCVSDHHGSGSLNESQSTASSTVNLTSRYLGINRERRSNSLVVEDTGRLNTRRSSAPDDSFISMGGFKNDGIECVRYHKSSSDIFNDQEVATQESNFDTESRFSTSTAFLGQTSTSFVFNGLIPRSKKYEVNSNESATSSQKPEGTEELTYKGFSSFDEIALTNPSDQQKDHPDDVSVVSSVNSNYLKLKPLQTMSDLADLGMQSLRPNFNLMSNLRKRRIRDHPEPGRLYKWRFGFQLVLAYLSFSMGMRPIVTIGVGEGPSHTSGEHKGAFFLAHAIIMVSVGLPLSYLLSVIGQFSGSGVLQVWKMVPAARGIGMALVVTMLINAVLNGVTVAYALYYLIFVIQSYLPWKECNPDYGADVHCQQFEVCFHGQICEDDRSSRPSAQFWRNHVVGRRGSSSIYEGEDIGYPKWNLLIALFIGWLLITLFTLKGMKILSRIIFLSGIVPFILLIALIFMHQKALEAETYWKMFAFNSISSVLSKTLWMEAAFFSAKSLAFSIGVLTCLTSYNRAHFKPAVIASLIIFISLFITWLSLLLSGIYVNDGSSMQRDVRSSYSNEDLIFDLFMDGMNTPGLAGLFILFILVTKLNSMAILTDSVVSSIEDSLSWVYNWRLLTFVIYCFTSFGLGIIFVVPNGSQILQNTRYAVESSSILLSFIMIFTIVYGYGLHRLSDNVYIMTGSPLFGLSKLWLAAFLPGSMVPIMVSYFNHSNFYGEHENLYANLHVYALILFITAMPFVYAIWMTCKAACERESIQSLFCATPGWPLETRSNTEQFSHSVSLERYTQTRRSSTIHKRTDFALQGF